MRLRTESELLRLLILADLLVIGLHLINGRVPFVDRSFFSIERERGLGEMFQYVKELWIGLALLGVSLRGSRRSFAIWSLLFGYLLLDDAFQLHEGIGRAIAESFDLPAVFGLRSVDLGELTVTAMAGTVFLSMFVPAYVRGSPEYRSASRALVAMVAALAVFGVAVDMIHVMVAETRFNGAFATIEDGGEMLVMSVIGWYAFVLLVRQHRPAESLVNA